MPVETRFFRSDKWADNLYKFLTTNTDIMDTQSKTVMGLMGGYMGIKVYVDDVCISGSDPVAQVNYFDGDANVEKSNTWTPPETDLSGKSLKIEVWWVGQGILGLSIFRTDVFSEGYTLSAEQWEVHYFGSFTYDPIRNRGSMAFIFGNASHNSRVLNFTYSEVAPVEKISHGDGLTFWDD